jgi:hypothetical protein
MEAHRQSVGRLIGRFKEDEEGHGGVFLAFRGHLESVDSMSCSGILF